eukprot:1907559-Rhodomonas_salina.5
MLRVLPAARLSVPSDSPRDRQELEAPSPSVSFKLAMVLHVTVPSVPTCPHCYSDRESAPALAEAQPAQPRQPCPRRHPPPMPPAPT